MNKTEEFGQRIAIKCVKLLMRKSMILPLEDKDVQITVGEILQVCKEALPSEEEIRVKLTQYNFGDIAPDQFIEYIKEVFGE